MVLLEAFLLQKGGFASALKIAIGMQRNCTLKMMPLSETFSLQQRCNTLLLINKAAGNRGDYHAVFNEGGIVHGSHSSLFSSLHARR
jgi:hypothetical protein